jgi:hypothetical protein
MMKVVRETAGDVTDIVRGEKINGAAFDVEIIEVLSYPSEHESY